MPSVLPAAGSCAQAAEVDSAALRAIAGLPVLLGPSSPVPVTAAALPTGVVLLAVPALLPAAVLLFNPAACRAAVAGLVSAVPSGGACVRRGGGGGGGSCSSSCGSACNRLPNPPNLLLLAPYPCKPRPLLPQPAGAPYLPPCCWSTCGRRGRSCCWSCCCICSPYALRLMAAMVSAGSMIMLACTSSAPASPTFHSTCSMRLSLAPDGSTKNALGLRAW